jgi:hypothetical protein
MRRYNKEFSEHNSHLLSSAQLAFRQVQGAQLPKELSSFSKRLEQDAVNFPPAHTPALVNFLLLFIDKSVCSKLP